ncbi:Fic/DOC family protein [Sinorhizobium medicae]
MADERPKGSYTYPNTSDDPDRTNVLKNRWGIETHSELRVKEYRATAVRMAELAEGDGPQGNFDKAHLKAIHGYIFQDVYEWAGQTRNESPVVEGQRVEPIGGLSKGGTSFLPGSRIEMGLDEALKPIRDPQALRNATIEEFPERTEQVLSEQNFVRPFREGNGHAQEACICELGRLYGREIDVSVITKPRMIEASIATTNDRPVPQ